MTEEGEPSLPRALGWTLALTATATMTVSYVDRQALAVLSPTITRDLKLTDADYGWVTAAFSIAYLVCAPLAGGLIDRVGARRGLLGSVLVWSAVAAAHALVPGLALLFLLRIALGIAEAPSFPGSAQTVSRVLQPRDRAAGFGLLFTGSSVGAAIAPLLAVPLAARFGWRYAMVATALIGLAWVPLWIRLTGIAEVRAAMAHGPSKQEADGGWASLGAHPAVLRAVALVMAAAPVNGFAINWAAKVLTAQSVPQAAMGHFLWLPPLAFDGGAVLAGLAASLLERRRDPEAPHRGLVAIGGLGLLAIGALGFARTPWQTTLAIALAFGGGGVCYAIATADMLRRVARSQVAAAGGVTAAAQSLALIVANPLIGRAVDHGHGYGSIGVALALCTLPGVLIWLAWDPRRS